ncbi:MAG: hypothetical protein PHC35_01670 [Deltaproteobacteria bacterium]|nr:hypothetical protein [Deltaproteobacteria bacterium]
MRREKIVIIGDVTLTVKEMRVCDIIRLQHDAPHLLVGMAIGDPEAIMQAMRLCVEPVEQLDAVTDGVNGYALLEQAWREVNADFLAVLPARLEVLRSVTETLGRSLTGATA